jgi:hypothetical protein
VVRAELTRAERSLATLATAWSALGAAELAAVNTALAATGLPALRPELAPETHQDAGNEE